MDATRKHALERIANAVIDGKKAPTVEAVRVALKEGIKPYDILMEGCKKGMDVVGDNYQTKKMYLPEVLSSAAAMYAAIDILKPHLKGEKSSTPGTIVIGVVEGDVHDIGKNIVRILLDGMAYTVHDLGRDVPLDQFLDKARDEKADVIACSTLMTTTLLSIEDLMKMMKNCGLDKKVKTIIGGAATNQEFADDVGANAWGKDASEGISKITAFIKERRGAT